MEKHVKVYFVADKMLAPATHHSSVCDLLPVETMTDETEEEGDNVTQTSVDPNRSHTAEAAISQGRESHRALREETTSESSKGQTRNVNDRSSLDRTSFLRNAEDDEDRDTQELDRAGAMRRLNNPGLQDDPEAETVGQIDASDKTGKHSPLQPEIPLALNASLSDEPEASVALQTDFPRSDEEFEVFFDEVVNSSMEDEVLQNETPNDGTLEASRSAMSPTEVTAMLSDEDPATPTSRSGPAEDPQSNDQTPTSASNLFDGDDDFLATLIGEQEPLPEMITEEPSEFNQMFSPQPETLTYGSEIHAEEITLTEEVPEGWYGENGEWNWYTDEERDLVRESMGLPRKAPETPERLASTPRWASASPLLLSESDARRTPVSEERVANAYTDDHFVAVAEANADAFDLMDRYAPKPSIPSINTPFASSSAAPLHKSDVSSDTVPPRDSLSIRNRPIVPSAYDPPQLRSQKSFIRSSAPHFTPPIPIAQPNPWGSPQHPDVYQTALDTREQSSRPPPNLAPPPSTKRDGTQRRSLLNQSEPPTFSSPPVVDTVKIGSRGTAASPPVDPYAPRQSFSVVHPSGSPPSTYDATSNEGRAQTLPSRLTPSPPPLRDLPILAQAVAPNNTMTGHTLQTSHYGPVGPASPLRSYTPLQPYSDKAWASPDSDLQSPSQLVEPTADVSYAPSAQNIDVPVGQEMLDRRGRSARRKPIFTFGFGGVVATSFPAVEVSASADTSLADLAAGYGYGSLRARVTVCTIGDCVPLSAVNLSDISFPGPLCGEGINNRAADKATKQRRESVLAYLSDRIDESVKALSFLSSSSSFPARRDESNRLIALRALKVLVTYNGVIPRTGEGADDLRDVFSLPERADQARFVTNPSREVTNEVTCPSAQEMLRLLGPLMSTGKTTDALELAIDRRAWAEALLLASSLGEAAWRRTTEIYEESLFAAGDADQSLRSTFAVLSGRSEDLVSRLCSLDNKNDSAFDHWERDVAALIDHGKPGEQDHLLRLGRHLGSLGMSSAAFTCFICSSELVRWSEGSFDFALLDDSSRLNFEDNVIMFEIAEFALALKRSTSKVRESSTHPSAGHAALLACKLNRAFTLAEKGNIENASRYCKALSGGHRGELPPYLLGNVQDLSDRLEGDISAIGLSSHSKGSKSAKLGSWVQGRFTKFIAGEDDSELTGPRASDVDTAPSGPVGPFTHWSSITPMPEGSQASHGFPSSDRFSGDDIPSSLLAAARDAYRPDSYSEQATPQPSPPSQYRPLQASRELEPLPPPQSSRSLDENDDDLGLGNYSSRPRTPRATVPESDDSRIEPKSATVKVSAEIPTASNAKSSWLGRLWGKKEGEGTGPVRAKLGDESSMVFDSELKRWIVKGAKVEAAPPSVAPPPRAQTASPAQRPPPLAPVPPSRSAVTNPPSMSSTPKPSDADDVSPFSPVGSAISAPPQKPPNRTATAGPPGLTAIDDLLTRPPSKRPGSAAAKKNIRKRYVDVLQPDA